MKIALLVVFTFLSYNTILSQVQPQSSLLWEVTGKGINKPSYLFGTFHIICKEDFVITSILKEKFDATEKLYEEMKMDDPSLQMKMMIKMKSDKSLKQLLDSISYKTLSDSFQKITGVPIAFFGDYKPFLCVSMLTQKMLPCKDVTQPETEFIKLGKEKQKEVWGLETIDDEINAIDKISIDSQLTSLVKMAGNFDSVKQVMVSFLEIYKKRNPDELYKFMQTNGVDGVFETAMLEERNNKWIPTIIKNIKKQPTFFAFGAGHLSGENGIITLLRKRGYKVTPVPY